VKSLRTVAPVLAVALVPALAALLASCAPAPSADASRLPRVLAAEFPVRIQGAGWELTLARPPLHVLPANAAWVDYVSLLVGPERVVALPAEAFGYSRLGREPGAWSELPALTSFEGERVLALAPDLVLVHEWQNAETIAGLRRAGVPVLSLAVPRGWSEITATLELLGVALGVRERAHAALAELEVRREALRTRARPFAELRALSYTNLGAGGWTSGASTTGEVLLELAGLHNAAAEAGLVGDVGAEQERLLALAPDVFVVGRPDRSESSPPSAEFLLSEPALRGLTAVRERRIVSLPPALFDSASPELLSGAEEIVAALEKLGLGAR